MDFINLCNIETINVNEGKFKVVINEKHLNKFGIAHGGLIYTLADTAMGLYINQKGNYVTVNSNINFLKPGIGTLFTNVTTVKHGTQYVILRCEVLDENHNLIGDATGTYTLL